VAFPEQKGKKNPNNLLIAFPAELTKCHRPPTGFRARLHAKERQDYGENIYLFSSKQTPGCFYFFDLADAWATLSLKREANRIMLQNNST
jgi:hypothetical protein